MAHESQSDIGTDELMSDSEGYVFVTPKKRRYRRKIYFDSLARKRIQSRMAKNENPQTEETINVPVKDQDIGTGQANVDIMTDISSPSGSSDGSETTELSSEHSCKWDSSDYSDICFESELSEDDHHASDNFLDSDEDVQCTQTPFSDRLFSDSKLSTMMSCILIILFVMKHGLGKEAFTDLLTLIKLHLPRQNNGISTIHKLKKILKQFLHIPDLHYHTYCSKCQRLLDYDNSCKVCEESSTLDFADLGFIQQLSELVKDDYFRKQIANAKGKTSRNSISDITDGTEHKRLTVDFQAHSKSSAQNTLHLTFTLNTDGVALFSSTKKGTLWPVYLAVNELPIKIRFSKKYLIPCYLFCQVEKPRMKTYLQPLMTALRRLQFQGLDIPTTSGVIRVFGHLLVATLDLPAKAMVANMKQFNGKSGCSVCLDEGVPWPNMPMLRYYPFDENSELRTHASWLRHAQDTINRDAVQGIKGSSALATLSYVNLPKVFAIDWMHCVLLGVVKSLMKCWFVGPRGNEYFIGDKIAFLNRKLQSIKVPDFMARTPRTLADHSHWKASECREWLFHFSVPLLSGVMKPVHLAHYALFVSAMVILNKEEIQMKELMCAEVMLLDFCRIFAEIYGAVKQTMNIHMLKHLPHFVKLHGPLFTTSCFGFESMNSHLKSMVHGTRHVTKQVSYALSIAKSLPSLVEKVTNEDKTDKKVVQFMKALTGHSDRVHENIVEEVILGKKKQFIPDNNLLEAFNLESKTCRKFYRLQTHRGVFFSRQYERVKCRNSFSVAFVHHNDETYGIIDYFVEADDDLFAVVTVMRKCTDSIVNFDEHCKEHIILNKYTNQTASLCPHITTVFVEGNVQLVPVSHIRCKCVYMPHVRSDTKAYMSVPPNLVEHS